ncbi:uncharacterized protein A4U43_C01F9780 [Asparagus officinalis]|uniref:Uncharacterized protein n=1 Tax=Asparagus officinalis TaxID=4686 RepID=A0A5P1FRZ4_ASPOF|nr:uncharacterized protein A4U43_C01F9780 [Asparagus officinalis]
MKFTESTKQALIGQNPQNRKRLDLAATEVGIMYGGDEASAIVIDLGFSRLQSWPRRRRRSEVGVLICERVSVCCILRSKVVGSIGQTGAIGNVKSEKDSESSSDSKKWNDIVRIR